MSSSITTKKVTAYGQFYDAVSQKVRSDNPTVKDIRKMVSEMWKNADNDTKEEYKQIASKVKEETVAVSGGKTKTATKTKTKTKSDKPLSAFMQYTNEVRNKVREENPGMKMPEVSKVIGQMWKDLGEVGKKPYFDRYKAEAEAKAVDAKSFQEIGVQTEATGGDGGDAGGGAAPIPTTKTMPSNKTPLSQDETEEASEPPKTVSKPKPKALTKADPEPESIPPATSEEKGEVPESKPSTKGGAGAKKDVAGKLGKK
jgi:hypothetical protein